MVPRVLTPAPKGLGLRPLRTLPFPVFLVLVIRTPPLHPPFPPDPLSPGVGGHLRVHGGISSRESADSRRLSCGALNYFSCPRLYSSPSADTAGALPCRFSSGNVHRRASASIWRSCIIPRACMPANMRWLDAAQGGK